MTLRGITFDVGRVPGMSWRPPSDPDIARATFAVPFNGQPRG